MNETEQVLKGVCPVCGAELEQVRIEGYPDFLTEYAMIYPDGEMVAWEDAELDVRGEITFRCGRCHRTWNVVNREGMKVNHVSMRFWDDREHPRQHWVLEDTVPNKGDES